MDFDYSLSKNFEMLLKKQFTGWIELLMLAMIQVRISFQLLTLQDSIPGPN